MFVFFISRNMLTGMRPDLTLSQFMWVNYSLHSFREKIKETYRDQQKEGMINFTSLDDLFSASYH
jgi:hypothetical protein